MLFAFSFYTSQCSWEKEVCSVFFDDVLGDGTECGTAAQLPDGLHELWVEGQSNAIVFSFQSQAVHLPASELSEMSNTHAHTENKLQSHHRGCSGKAMKDI